MLFLDELGEFPVAHLEALRQPLEHAVIHLSRAQHHVVLPADFLLVAATNPCPCGVGAWGACTCSPAQVDRYRRRFSGPILDRFDLRIGVDPPDPTSVLGTGPGGEHSAAVRARVAAARARARARGVSANRQLDGEQLDVHAPLTDGARRLLRDHLAEGRLSMRGAQRARSVALTLADLAGTDSPLSADVVEQAVWLRGEPTRPELVP